jgi:hypothetical protein
MRAGRRELRDASDRKQLLLRDASLRERLREHDERPAELRGVREVLRDGTDVLGGRLSVPVRVAELQQHVRSVEQ